MPIPGTKHGSFLLSPLIFLCMIGFVRCADDETRTLLDFKSGLQSTDESLFDTWSTEGSISPCNFAGITCNKAGSVAEIDITSRGISGSLRLDALCKLPSLHKVSMAYNHLTGSLGPDLRNCSNLIQLDLYSNGFYGTVPDLSPLTKLQVLNLSQNGFTGLFPWSSLKGLTNLTDLIIGDNLYERTSFPDQILGLKKLSSIYLTNCSLEGRIPPAIGDLPELRRLELSGNTLSGAIPVELTKLTNLKTLEMYENQFTGTLPNGFSNLVNLEYFDASTNLLEGDLQELKNLSKLVSLQLFNNQFTGEIPAELGDFRALVNLSLYSNKLVGTLPQKLGSWAEFDFIDVSDNSLTGPIPPDMCKRGAMTRLLMLDNQLTGEIPASYGDCRTLERFRVSNNKLSGAVPSKLWGLPKAKIIDLGGNDFEGPITSDVRDAIALAVFVISDNMFSGQIPLEISKARSLVSIDASSNRFSGDIPKGIGELKRLNGLYLQRNKLTGEIPDELASCALNEIDLSYNALSGDIPGCLSSLTTLNSLNLSNNRLSGRIPASLSTMRLSLLDLSNNRLSGPIPPALQVRDYDGVIFDGNPDLCSSTSTTQGRLRPCRSGSSKSGELRTFLSCFLAGSAVLGTCLACYIYFNKRRSDQLERETRKDHSWDLKSFQVLTFTGDEILNGMKEDNVIGKGGSGNVYRVILGNGVQLAVKHIWNARRNGITRSSSPMLAKRRPAKLSELEAEVVTLSSIRHVNVVKLYCSITSEDSSLLVYEYLPNGSLWDRLHEARGSKDVEELHWRRRYEIAVGSAKGLEYLHHGCERPIIHRDVKSSNILLDESFKPRIADFGLAKIVPSEAGAVNDYSAAHVIAGTHGYIAPEYGYTYRVTEKSDVYSFGVVLLELVTGKKPMEPEFGENKDLVWWVSSRTRSRSESLTGVVDPRIPESLRADAVKMLRVAMLCTARLPALRPSMRTVVQLLEDAETCS